MKRNFVYTAVSIGSRLVAGLMLFVVLARVWTPSDLGLFSFVFGLSMVLVLLVDFGFSSYLLREIGAEPSNLAPVFRNSLIAKLFLIGPFIAISAIVMWFYGAAAPWQLAAPMLVTALLLSFSEYCIAPLRALGRYDLETAVITSSNLINFVAAGCTAWLGGTPFDVAFVCLLTRAQYFFTAAWVLHRVAPGIASYKGNRPPLRQIFKHVLPYGADGLLSTAWNQLDIVVVGSIFGPHNLGIYAAGQKMVQGLYTLAQVIGNVMIPRLARLAHTQSPALASNARKTMFNLSAVGILLALPLWLWSGELTHLLFGAKYSELKMLMPFFALILVLRYISAGSGVVITALGKQRFRAVAQSGAITLFIIGSGLVAIMELSLSTLLGFYAFSILSMVISFQIALNGVHSPK